MNNAVSYTCPFCGNKASRGVKTGATTGVTRQSFKRVSSSGGEVVEASSCPPAIIDTAPGGGGLGVWILIGSDSKSCTYEYGGGIS